jgi:hypothetical protein
MRESVDAARRVRVLASATWTRHCRCSRGRSRRSSSSAASCRLHKALRTRDLSSYSLGNIALANLGNAVHSVYVFALPPGPIWVLHTFYLLSSALMLFWYVRSRQASRPDPVRVAP